MNWKHVDLVSSQKFSYQQTVIAECDGNTVAQYKNTTCSFQSEAAQALYQILYAERVSR